MARTAVLIPVFNEEIAIGTVVALSINSLAVLMAEKKRV